MACAVSSSTSELVRVDEMLLGDPGRGAPGHARAGAGLRRPRAARRDRRRPLAGAAPERGHAAGDRRARRWRCRTSTRATAFRSAASRPWSSRTASSRRAASATTSTAACACSSCRCRGGAGRAPRARSCTSSRARDPGGHRQARAAAASTRPSSTWCCARGRGALVAARHRHARTTSSTPSRRAAFRAPTRRPSPTRAHARGARPARHARLGQPLHRAPAGRRGLRRRRGARPSACARGRLTVLIHSGSRGLGHQVCTDHVRVMDAGRARATGSCSPTASSPARRPRRPKGGRTWARWPPRPTSPSPTGTRSPTPSARRSRRVLGPALADGDAAGLRRRPQRRQGRAPRRPRRCCVHRKGATRAFPAGSPEIPACYRAVGQPVFIPGSMGTASFVLAGEPGLDGALVRHDLPRRRPAHVAAPRARKRIGGAELRRAARGAGDRRPLPLEPEASPRRRPSPTRTSSGSSRSSSGPAWRAASRGSCRSASSRARQRLPRRRLPGPDGAQ